MKTTTIQSPFRTALADRLISTVRQFRAAGDTGCSLECLNQCVAAPDAGLEGAPRGTNARYYYAQLFREVVESLPSVRSFIIAS